jgi:hypothetical protein
MKEIAEIDLEMVSKNEKPHNPALNRPACGGG